MKLDPLPATNCRRKGSRWKTAATRHPRPTVRVCRSLWIRSSRLQLLDPFRPGRRRSRRPPPPHQAKAVHHRPHLPGSRVAQVPRSPRQHQQQHADGRDELLQRQSQLGQNQLNGQYDEVPNVQRAYKTAGIGSIVVGDENYGEGSSREPPPLEPHHLGVRAVLVKSFARIPRRTSETGHAGADVSPTRPTTTRSAN